MYKKERLVEYLSKPQTISKVTKGSFLFGIITTVGVMIWFGTKFWKTDYFFIIFGQGFILWRLIKLYKGVV